MVDLLISQQNYMWPHDKHINFKFGWMRYIDNKKYCQYMIKPCLREPIHLAKLKKKTKNEETAPEQAEQSKTSIQYDLQIFQESLNIHKQRNTEEINWQQRQSDVCIDPKELVGNEINNSLINSLKFMNDLNPNFNRTLNQPFEHFLPHQNLISSECNHYSSMHKTKICFKPNTLQAQNKENKENATLQGKQNIPKARAISTVSTLKSEVLRQIKMANKLQVTTKDKSEEVKERNEVNKSKLNEQRIRELEQKNECADRKIIELQTKLKEKEQMMLRVEQIEQDLNFLFQQNKELLKINQSLAKLSPDVSNVDMQIQTDIFPLFVNDSFCQTIPQELQHHQIRSSISYEDEENIKNSKQQKLQLLRERIAAKNKQIQFKTSIDNIHIEYRQQIARLQKQLQAMTIKYDQKCQEVKDKESLISKYLLNK